MQRTWALALVVSGVVLLIGIFQFAYIINQFQVSPKYRPFTALFWMLAIAVCCSFAAGGAYCLVIDLGKKPVKGLSLAISRFLAVTSVVLMVLGIAGIVGGVYALASFSVLMAGDFVTMVIIAGATIISLCVLLITGGLAACVAWKKRKEVTVLGRSMGIIGITLFASLAIAGPIVAFIPPATCKDFPADLPYKVDMFAQNTSGYNTYKIPALLVTPNGTILAFCEGRVDNNGDFDDIDMMLRKSYDNGTTWTSQVALIDDGTYTIGNPCPVVDADTGTIFLLYCRENDLVFIINSTDNGETWSNPFEITSQVKLPGWKWYATGPTHGIQIRATRRIVIPCDHIVNYEFFSHVIYSDDHGLTWSIGGSVPGGDESTIVETENGSLYINMRSERPRRLYAWSHDGGLTWSEPRYDETLVEPVCQGNLLRYTNLNSFFTSRVLFSNPHSTYRENMTVKISYDECNTWVVGKVLYPGLASYSDLASTPWGEYIFCLFEVGCNFYAEKIVFARFTLDWLTNGTDALDPRP